MLSDAQTLGDAGKESPDGKTFDPAWEPEFKKGTIDGVILVAGDCFASVTKALNEATDKLHHTVNEVIEISGHTRPGKEDGHEHFGFEDGISNPAVAGITTSQEGPSVPPVDPG